MKCAIADLKHISDAVVKSLRDKKLEMSGEIAEKDAEIARLRKLIGEMADRMQNNPCEVCDYFGECEYQGCGEAAITNKLIDRGREAAE